VYGAQSMVAPTSLPTELAASQQPFRLPVGARSILLIRHGASDNSARPMQLIGGHANPPLASAGVTQARMLAARLRREPITGIFVTPLQRTAQTAAPLALATDIAPRVVGELREVHLGEWERGELEIRLAQEDQLARRVFREGRWDLIPGAESSEAFAGRVRAGIEVVAAETAEGAISVAFTHGGVVAEACRQVTASAPFAFLGAENASITWLVLHRGDRWSVRSFNDTAHLAAPWTTGPHESAHGP
jgi:probable phosphoglycerate mutase